MSMNTVHVAVYDTLADWEIGYALAHLRGGARPAEAGDFQARTVGPSLRPVVTMGGLRVLPDLALADLQPADSDVAAYGELMASRAGS